MTTSEENTMAGSQPALVTQGSTTATIPPDPSSAPSHAPSATETTTPEPTAEEQAKIAADLAQKEQEEAAEKNRVDLITKRLKETLGLEVTDVKPIGRGNNSIMRLVTFLPSSNSTKPTTQPLTSPLDPTLTTCLVREANPEGELVPSTAIPNEVIALHFARESGLPVPRVWDWRVEGEGEGSIGWMVLEVLEGEPLDSYVNGLDLDSEDGKEALKKVLEEEARVVKQVQEIRLPPNVQFGGFRFVLNPNSTADSSDSFTIESGPMPLPYGGPHPTLSALYAEMIDRQLGAADKCAILDGWRQDGLRDRLDRFVKDGLKEVLRDVKADGPVFVHGDLNMANMLFDPATKRITGLIDFEWAHAAGPADEWFYSFGMEVGCYGGPYDGNDAQDELLNRCIMTGEFPSPPPPTGPRPSGRHDPTAPPFHDFPRALLWSESLLHANARRPSDTPGFEDAARVYWMAQEIAQWWILQERIVRRLGVVRMGVKREECRRNLGRYLEHWGY